MQTARRFASAALAAILFAGAGAASAATEVRVMHYLQGGQARAFDDLVARFNREHPDVRVATEPKASAQEALDAGIAAAHAKRAPHLLQAMDVDSDQLMRVKGMIKPVGELLATHHAQDLRWFVPSTVSFVRDPRGKMIGFPYMGSVPALYVNIDAMRKAGIETDVQPRTWFALQASLLKLRAAGYRCTYTTSHPAWIHVESLSAWHNEPFATRQNGQEGTGAKLLFNDLLHVRHISLMMSWVKSELFDYVGRDDEADARFVDGTCPVLSSATAALGTIQRNAKFNWRMWPVPHYEEASLHAVNQFVGGAALWATGGKTPAEYKAVATFLAWLSTPVVAAEWHQRTGFLPLTNAAYLAAQESYYDRLPGLEQVISRVAEAHQPFTRGIRLPSYHKVREAIEVELEAVWRGGKPPKQGLDDAVANGNAILTTAK